MAAVLSSEKGNAQNICMKNHKMFWNKVSPQMEEEEEPQEDGNLLLYFGLGLMSVGSVISFVGELC